MVSCKFEFVIRSTHLLFTPKKHSLLIWILKFICQVPFFVSFELSFFKCNHFMKKYEFSSLSLTIETFWQNIFSTNIFGFFSFSFFKVFWCRLLRGRNPPSFATGCVKDLVCVSSSSPPSLSRFSTKSVWSVAR